MPPLTASSPLHRVKLDVPGPTPRTAGAPAVRPHVPPVAMAIAALCALVAVLFAPFLLTGRVPYGGDLLMLNYPLFSLLHRSFTSGVLPLWNPFSGGGYPLAPFSALAFYPPSWLLLVLPATAALGWTYCCDFLVAGVFMLLLARRLGCSAVGGFVAATTFILSGYMLAHLYAGHVLELGVIAWMPAVFYAAHSALGGGGRRSVVLGGLFLGLQVLANGVEFLPFVLYPLLFVLAWYGVQAARQRVAAGGHITGRQAGRVVLALAAVGSIAAGLSAVLMLPFLQVLGHTVRHAGVPFADAAHLSLPLYALGMLAVPGFFGDSVGETYWLEPGQHLYWHELYAFVGIVPLVLAIWAWTSSRRPSTTTLYTVVAVIGLLLALGRNTPFYRLIYTLLPGMSLIRVPSRWLLVVTFAVAILAAQGTDGLLARTYARGRVLRWLLLISGAIVVICLVPVIVVARLPVAAGQEPLLTPLHWQSMEPAVVRLGVALAAVSLLILAYGHGHLGRRSVALLLVVLTVFDLGSANAHLLRFMDPRPSFASVEVTALLHSRPGDYRVLALDHSLPLRAGMVDDRILDVQDYAPMTLADYWLYTHPHDLHDLRKVTVTQIRDIYTVYDATMARLLGVRYVFTDRPLHDPSLRLLARINATHWQVPHNGSWNGRPWRGTTYAYRNAAAVPAAFFVSRWRTMANDREARALSARGTSDPRRLALVGPPPAAAFWERLPMVQQIGRGWAAWLAAHDRRIGSDRIAGWRVDTGQNSVRIRGRAPTDGYLVLDDVYYPGWTAMVDGQPALVTRANYLLRSVYLRRGYHEVRFTYAPLSVLAGLAITLLTAAAVLLFCGLVVRRRVRRRGVPDPAHRHALAA